MKCAGITRKYRNQIFLIEEGIGTYFSLGSLKPIGEKIVPDRALVGFPEIYGETHSDEAKVIKLRYAEFFNEEHLKAYMKKSLTEYRRIFYYLGGEFREMNLPENVRLTLSGELGRIFRILK